VSPEDLAARHPLLFHLTDPEAWPGIARHGLLAASRLLDLFEVPPEERSAIEGARRPAPVPMTHPRHGRAVISDNLPLTEKALAGCLDDGLSPADWLALLNARVFFWPDEGSLAAHLAARFLRGKPRLVLVFDTLSLTRAHAARVELAPINTGSTIRRPARRGLATFTPLLAHPYPAWRRLRGGLDAVREVTVHRGVPDAAAYLVETRRVVGG
jgi:hypothetical protein